MLVAALSLAATAAYYSVYGISKLFTAQATAVIVMASMLEASKLITAAYLERFWSNIHWIRKMYLTSALLILMAITSLGIYGFLVSAYQETAYKIQSIDKLIEVQQTKQNRYQEQIIQLTTERDALNANISELTKGLANNILTRTDRNGNVTTTTSQANRKALEKQLEQSTTRVAALTQKEATLNDSITALDLRILDIQTNTDVAAEIGPLRYVASITGKSVDVVVNWFILLFIVVFDPLAIILLISANKALGRKDDEESVAEQEQVKAPTSSPEPDTISDNTVSGIGSSPIAEHRRNPSVIGSKWWGK